VGGATPTTLNVEILDIHVAGGAESSYVFTPPSPLLSSKYMKFVVIGMGSITAAASIRVIINQDENTAYTADGYRIAAGVETLLNLANQNQYEIINSVILAAADFFAFEFTYYPSLTALSVGRAILMSKGGTDLGIQELTALFHLTGGIDPSDELAEIEIETSASTWKTGSAFIVLGYLRAVNP